MSKPRPATSDPSPRLPSQRRPSLVRAEILAIEGDDTVLLRLRRARTEEVLRAEIAVVGYVPCAGDSVLCDRDADGWFVLGVLGAARRRPTAVFPGGLTATASETGVELRLTEGDLTLSAAGRLTVRSDTDIAITADAVRTTAKLVSDSAGRRETVAERILERATDVYREAKDLTQLTAGRARTQIQGDHDMHAARTTITSEEDTSIDGERVLLG